MLYAVSNWKYIICSKNQTANICSYLIPANKNTKSNSLTLKVGMNHIKFELHTQKKNCHVSLITVNIPTSSPMYKV